MTHTQRAEKMVQTMLLGVGDGKSYFDYFLSQLEAVAQEARKLGVEEYIGTLNEQGDRECGHPFGWQTDTGCDLCEAYASGFSAGAREMREKCGMFVATVPTHPTKFSVESASIIANGLLTLPLPAAKGEKV